VIVLLLGLVGLWNFIRTRGETQTADTADTTPTTTLPDSNATAPDNTAPGTPIEPSPLPDAPENTQPLTREESQAILARARTYIQSNQASGFSQAIAEASKITPGSELYEEAQADIARWSQVIIDIAQGRANQGDFQGAIAAANLVPPEPANAYQTAQQQVTQWTNQLEQQQRNAELIRQARRQIRYTQASSYSQGITTLRQIPANQPGYSQAQELITRWSQQIYLIANSRASQGNYEQAIETARLVPQGTASYEAAQGAIARWQQQ
jgi:hypothetical protein